LQPGGGEGAGKRKRVKRKAVALLYLKCGIVQLTAVKMKGEEGVRK
jgi:hypothetical protein